MDRERIKQVVDQLQTEFPRVSREVIERRVNGLVEIADEQRIGERAAELLAAAITE